MRSAFNTTTVTQSSVTDFDDLHSHFANDARLTSQLNATHRNTFANHSWNWSVSNISFLLLLFLILFHCSLHNAIIFSCHLKRETETDNDLLLVGDRMSGQWAGEWLPTEQDIAIIDPVQLPLISARANSALIRIGSHETKRQTDVCTQGEITNRSMPFSPAQMALAAQ